MEMCLRSAGRIGLLNFDSIYIQPIERGSIKTTFRYVKKNPLQIVSGLGFVVQLFANSFTVIDHFGINNVKAPTKEILETIGDRKILQLCQNNDFRIGVEKIAQPVNEITQKAQIRLDDRSIEITCDNRERFLIGNLNEKILPELINGETVELTGEITRINKTPNNDLGFEYKNRRLAVVPLEEDKSTADFHQYLAYNSVKLKGVIVRNSEYEAPRIKVISITDNTVSQKEIFHK
jgi:hypothetical protein